MNGRATVFDQDERRAFVAQEIMRYRADNPGIRTVIYRIWDIGGAGHDFLTAMWPLFMGLNSVTVLLGQLPRISDASEEQAWTELHEAPDNVLDGEGFDEFRVPIEVEFRMNLAVSVTSPGVRRRVERNFAMILRMIQIELGKQAGGPAADQNS